jgi:hypothetical protein
LKAAFQPDALIGYCLMVILPSGFSKRAWFARLRSDGSAGSTKLHHPIEAKSTRDELLQRRQGVLAKVLHCRGVDLVYCFRGAMSSNNRLDGSPSQQSVERSREARLVRIAHGTLAIGLDPFGMLDPQIVVNLLPEFGVGMDLVIDGYWPGERFKGGATVRTMGSAESLTGMRALSARYAQVNEFQMAASTCLRCARRPANWITLSRCRRSKTASSPLCVRVGVNFLIT